MARVEYQSQIARCAALMAALAPNIVAGLSVSELSQRTKLSMPVVCRTMDILAEIGWAKKMENGHWCLTTKPIALARACELALQTARERMEDFKHNVSAGALRILGDEDARRN